MDKHSGITVRKAVQLTALACLSSAPWPAFAELALSTELYSAATQQHQNNETDNSLQLGNTTSLGYRYTAGPHRFNTGYNLNLSQTYFSGSDSDASYSGSTGYRYTPGRYFDTRLGHSVRAASTEASLLADIRDYELRHSLTSSTGIKLEPGSRTQSRFEVQGTLALDRDLERQGHQVTGRLNNSLQLSRIDSASLSASRAIQWDENQDRTSTTDALQFGYQRALPNGSASASAGISFYQAGNSDRTLITAGLNRNWLFETAQLNASYNRSISDTLTELSNEVIVLDPENPPETPDDIETETEVVEIQQATLADSLSLTYRSQGLCERCTYGLNANFTTQSVLFGGDRSYKYSAGANLGFRLSTLQDLSAQYQWQATADTFTGGPESQQHRVNLGTNRRLSSQVQANASLEHGWEDETNNRKTTARLSVRVGLIN